MTEQILRSSLHHALKLDPELCEWFMTRLNLSLKATVEFRDILSFKDYDYNPMSGDMFGIVDNRGHDVALHIVPLLRNLEAGMGDRACARAKKMQQDAFPSRYESHRVVLVAPSNLVRTNWQAAREFPFWIDFDAITRRQINHRAA